jgi:hypothetical protein
MPRKFSTAENAAIDAAIAHLEIVLARWRAKRDGLPIYRRPAARVPHAFSCRCRSCVAEIDGANVAVTMRRDAIRDRQ